MRYIGVRIAKTLFGKVYPDLARMEDLLRDSGLDWTVLRPPRLTSKRSPAPTAPQSGAMCAGAGPSPAPTSRTACSPWRAGPTPSAR
jgi:hypothetical protein